MIIELFGPPGVGKTTFSRTLATRLREHGHVVELLLSYRPAEQGDMREYDLSTPRHTQVAAVARRLGRPLVDMLTIARHPLPSLQDAGTASSLMRLLPPKNFIWSIRLNQYLIRLLHSWHRASKTGHITIFDQAFVQAVCSLALLCPAANPLHIAQAIDHIPKADIFIRMEASEELLEDRLRRRRHLQGLMEQLFEFDLATNLKSIGIISQLDTLLREHTETVICVNSLDSPCIDQCTAAVERRAVQTEILEHKKSSNTEGLGASS